MKVKSVEFSKVFIELYVFIPPQKTNIALLRWVKKMTILLLDFGARLVLRRIYRL